MINNFRFRAVIMVITFFYFNGIAQKEKRFPLTDAIKYADNIKENKPAEAYQIFMAYSPDSSNKFIPQIPNLTEGIIGSSNVAEIDGSSQNKDVNPLGAPLIDGLSTVIAKRFKEELTLAFLENFRNKLKAEPYLGSLFPNAKLVLLNEDVFNVNLWLVSFRGALDEDLRALPKNIPFLLKAIKENVKLNDDQEATLKSLILLYEPSLHFASHPEKSYQGITGLLDAVSKVEFKDQNVAPALTFFHLLIKELGNSTYDDWAKKGAIDRISGDPKIAQAFIGFTIEKYQDTLTQNKVEISEHTSNLYDHFTSASFNKVNESVQLITTISVNTKTMYQAVNDIVTKRRNARVEYSDYASLINKSIETLEIIADDKWLAIFDASWKKPEKVQDILHDIKTVNLFATSIKQHIDDKAYSKILVSTLSFMQKIIPQSALNESTAFAEFTRYANLAVSLTGATTSEEMVSVLEGAALPVQSYRLKRNSNFSISLNSYAGVFIAAENLTNADVKNTTSGLVGVTAPIGIGFNWGLNTKIRESDYGKYPSKTIITQDTNEDGTKLKRERYFNGHSISLFTSFVDVGALATFRLSDDQTPVGDIQWQNVFAPGGYAIWGIGKTPLSLGVGAQYGPELRSVTAKDGVASSVVDSRGWRFGVSFTVDIPLLQLYRRADKTVKK